MFLNGKSIVYMVLLKIIVSQVIQDTTQADTLINQPITIETNKQICGCLNNGQCYSPLLEDITVNKKKQVYCRCPIPYIGDYCQFQGIQISNSKQITQKINVHDYKYFYYEPIEQNMYSFSFDLCLDNKTSSKINQEKITDDQISFFITTQDQYGAFQTDQEITKATTVSFQTDQCKQISIDYTVLLITKLKTIQKLIFAVKLGEKLKPNDTKIDKQIHRQKQNIKTVEKQIKKRQPSEKQQSQTKDKITVTSQSTQKSQTQKNKDQTLSDYHPIPYNIYSQKKKSSSLKQEDTNKKDSFKNINDFKSKSPSKLKQNDDPSTSKSLTISFSASPFMVEFVVFNILFSLTTLVAFIIVGVIIFIVRSRILGITISSTLGISSRLINDLKHFDRYLPEQKFIKKQRKQGDLSPNSSEIQCAICLVKFQEMDSIRKTPCAHSFHKSCIDSWCHENLTCPMCRKSLTEKNLMQYYNSTALELKNSPESDQ